MAADLDEKHLLDQVRDIEGFPIGEDEDLLALSDPPHYTAYPNPHVSDFIEKWSTPYDETTDDYHREPFVSDVSEGKGGAIYSAHTYHTKVPYKAIVPFIEHYTEPGDIVFDGFCGSGMTGIAAQMAGRRAILCDLSPAATFIAYNYNTPVDSAAFKRAASHILRDAEVDCGWMYETRHTDGHMGRIRYTVWSDVFICPYCNNEFVFWNAAVDAQTRKVRRRFPCPHCQAVVTKRDLSRVIEQIYDSALGTTVGLGKLVPVLINYEVDGKRFDKEPDVTDLALIRKIEESEIPYWYPTRPMDPDSDRWPDDAYYLRGITHVHHFYTKRNLWITAYLWAKIGQVDNPRLRAQLLFWVQSVIMGFSKLNRYLKNAYSQVNRMLSGTLYVGSTISEVSPWYALDGKVKRMAKASSLARAEHAVISTCSATAQVLPANSVDYVFVDPPFGSNLIYSDLSIIWESWLQVWTNASREAVIHRNKSDGNTLATYRGMMTEAFLQMHRVLKPGRWITVEFHNTRADVWNAIQEALSKSGFVVAQVAVLDKQQETFKQVTAPGAVKNDLVISAYKPRAGFSQHFLSQAGKGLEADFVRQHLTQLPISANVERSKEMLYSKYLAYYVQHGYQVAYNAEQFYRALPQWGLVELDGYWFADEAQANDYEKRKAETHGKSPAAQHVLFISDERSARQWLWHFLETPKTYDEIYTAFVQALQTSEDQLPEPMTMLEEGFVRTDGKWKRPDALTQVELEKRRQARLLRQFEEYLETARAGRRLKEVRKEALVAGFVEAYRAGRYRDIVAVGRRLDKRLLESSPDLFDFVDIAEAKVEA